MGIIQRADLPEKIRRAFGLRERGVGATVSPEIVPVALVEDLTGPTIDEGFPRLCCGYSDAGQSAGVFSEAFLINPAGTQVDLVTTEIWLRRPVAGVVYIRAGETADLNNLNGTQTRRFNFDLRVQQFPNATVDSRNQAAAIAGRGIYGHEELLSGSAWYSFPMEFTIPPGTWISFTPSANNNRVQAKFYWYERLRTTT